MLVSVCFHNQRKQNCLPEFYQIFLVQNQDIKDICLAFALPCLVLPCLALPCLALPCLALPCLALPCNRTLVAAPQPDLEVFAQRGCGPLAQASALHVLILATAALGGPAA
jgi:hypothetical protein